MKKINYIFLLVIVLALFWQYGLNTEIEAFLAFFSSTTGILLVCFPVIYFVSSLMIATAKKERSIFAWVRYYDTNHGIKLSINSAQDQSTTGDTFLNRFVMFGYHYRYLVLSIDGLSVAPATEDEPLKLLVSDGLKAPYTIRICILKLHKLPIDGHVYLSEGPDIYPSYLCLLFLDFKHKSEASGIFQKTDKEEGMTHYQGFYKEAGTNVFTATMMQRVVSILIETASDNHIAVETNITIHGKLLTFNHSV
jgi:hypothetical protein